MKLIGLAVVALLAAGMICGPVAAAETPSSFGFIDVQGVFDGYEKTQKSNAQLDMLSKQLETRLKTISEFKLLDEAEGKELMDLKVMENPADKDKDRMKALEDKERALDAELKDLQSKKEPTDQDKARLKELQDISAASDNTLLKLNEDYTKQLRAKNEELAKEIRDDMLKAIETVAGENKINVVLDKIAVLYGGMDLTEAVTKELNKKR